MYLILINYADGEKFQALQAENHDKFGPYVERGIAYNSDILDDRFKFKNRYILSQKHGAGNALWKPYIIQDALYGAQWGDVVLYMDVTDEVKYPSQFFQFVRNTMGEDKDQFLIRNVHRNSDWTKRDCFILMDCDNPNYWWASQLEAGIVAFRKTKFNMELVEEWLNICQVPAIMTDDKSIHGEDLEGFVQTRCDQSVLTNLQIKYGLPTVPIQDVLPMITYNGRG